MRVYDIERWNCLCESGLGKFVEEYEIESWSCLCESV